LLAYPVLGTLFLWTGAFERVMRSDDLTISIRHPSWTLWPGHIHVAAATVRVNGETQFELQAKNLLLHVNLFSLFHHHLHVTHISADDVRFFLRVQVQSTKNIERRLAAYPPLPDLPGDKSIVESREEKAARDAQKSAFIVELDGIDVRVSELWFMEYHFVGPGTLKGGFLVGPNRMRVDTSVQDLGPGELRFGADQVIAKGFGGRVQANIPEVNPMEHADESFLELVTADIAMKGDIVTLQHVGAYLPGMRVEGGAGPFDVHVLMTKGGLSDSSRLSFSTKKVGLRADGFGVDTDWNFDAQVARVVHPTTERYPSDDTVLPRLHSESRVTYVSVANARGDVFTVQLQKHVEDVVLRSNQLGRMTDLDHARIRFPEIFTNDLHDLAALTSTPPSFHSEAGEAHASLALDVDEHHVARGPFEARFTGLRFAAAGMLLRGQGSVKSRLEADLDAKKTILRNTFIDLNELGMQVGNESMEGWWTRIDVPYFAAFGVPPERIEGSFAVRAKSAEPLLKALAGKGEITPLIPWLTNLNDLRARATFHKIGPTINVMLEPVQNVLFDVAGRYYSKGDDSRMAIVVGGKVVSLGIAKDSGGLTLAPFAREGWLNEKLARFPKPVQKVHSSEP
jgi:hypothetical protein